jgi:hypothetical protein
MSQNNIPAPTLNAFAVMSNWLFAAPVSGGSKRPSFRFQVIGNVPRMVVKTGVEGDMNHGKIDFRCDLPTFGAMVHYVRQLLDGKDVPAERIFTYEDDFVAGKKLDKPMVLAKLMVGREAESGRIYIAIISTQPNRPRIRFFFGPAKYHNITNADGSTISPKEMSEAYAYGFVVPAEAVVYNLMVSQFDPNAKNVANPANFAGGGGGGQGGGGFNRGGQGGGGNNFNRGGNGGGGGNSYGGGAPAKTNFEATFEDIPDF